MKYTGIFNTPSMATGIWWS